MSQLTPTRLWVPRTRRSADLVLYAAAIVVSVLVAIAILGLFRGFWNVPLTYTADGLGLSAGVKGIIDNGQPFTNHYLGAPGMAQFFDSPSADGLFTLEIWLLARFNSDYVMVLNLFMLLTYPLIALTSVWAMRRLGVGRPVALVFSLLYAFLPFHQSRLPFHTYLSAYWVVPLAIMLIVEVVLGDRTPTTQKHSTMRRLTGLPGWGWLVVLVMGMCGVYYAFFAVVLTLVAGGVKTFVTRDVRRLVPAVVIAVGTLLIVVLQFAPSYVHWNRAGNNNLASARVPWESDLYALRMTQLVFPRMDHRVPVFAKAKVAYRSSLSSISDKMHGIAYDSSLGLVGTAGFFFLLFWLLTALFRGPPKPGDEVPARLTLLGTTAFLLGTVGGVGEILAYLGFPAIRAYDRITVYIGFVSLAGAAWAVDRALPWIGGRIGPRRNTASGLIAAALLLALLVLGVWDQTSPADAPPYAEIQRQFDSDRSFVQSIERAIPPGSSVLQLPYISFPESPTVVNAGGYDPLRLYLHSQTLRWSAGAFRGREDAQWQQAVSSLPVVKLIAEAAQRGFGGIEVDRFGFEDGARDLESALSASLLGILPIVSPDGRYAFYAL